MPFPARPPIVRIAQGTFYRHHPSSVPVTSRPGGQFAAHQAAHRNPPLFTDLSFALPSGTTDTAPDAENWCVVGPSLSGKTTLLQILRGQHICLPPKARSFPYLSTDAVPKRLRNASRAIRYVGFDAEGSGLGPATSAYLSARYESLRETTDFSLRDYLLGNTELNPFDGGDARETDESEEETTVIPPALFDRVVQDLRLGSLLALPVSFLSNGQGRRARIGRALLMRPAVLLLDEPFMGLDPPTVAGLSPLLRDMAAVAAPRLVLSSRPQDPLPAWVTHVAYLRTDGRVAAMGPRDTVLDGLRTYVRGVRSGSTVEDAGLPVRALGEMGRLLTEHGIEGKVFAEEDDEGVSRSTSITTSSSPASAVSPAEPLVEMDGCRVQYGDRVVLGNWTQTLPDGPSVDGLVWTVRRGERWGVFGPNGSGKTTIVSLLSSDHPQAYSLPMRLFGRSRLPEAGAGTPLTFWDIQSRVGHSSPEVHQHMPRNLTVRQIVESAWAQTFRSRPRLPADAPAKVDACLRWFAPELHPSAAAAAADSPDAVDSGDLRWADEHFFGELSFSAQRVLLLIRAAVKQPDIVVLDEAFSGMDESVRDKCTLFLRDGARPLAATADTAPSVGGLTDQQALICIAHVREEVPDVVREWLCLPEADTGLPARFGRLDGPLRTSRRRWDEIWGVES